MQRLTRERSLHNSAHRVLDGKMTEYCPGRAYKAFPTMETVRQPASVFTWARSTFIFLHPGAIRLKWARPPMDREGFQPRQLVYEEVLTCAKIFCR